ncbi:MAG: bifunctional DNA-formamidopyrimidine glycosylase/DNA-(apurinic or apyrimidinic site) lyase [bacterium]
MPELPEVETIRRQLLPLVGQQITAVATDDPDVFADDLDLQNTVKRLVKQELFDFQRYGKYLLIKAGENWLIFHPRMSGKVWLRSEPPPLPDRVKLELKLSDSGGRKMYFTTVRRFSRFYWHNDGDPAGHPRIAKLGPDPLHGDYTLERFIERIQGRRGGIKNLLLNQSFVAGIGNIYACEICFRTGIDPRRPADQLSGSEIEDLFVTIPVVLKEAIAAGGSSLNSGSSATVYRGVGGEVGSYADSHLVYGRGGEKCRFCGGTIKKIKVGGRSTFLCEHCQR